MRPVVDLVREQFGVQYNEIVLFRHTKKDSDVVLRYCSDLNDWTACQPSGGRYDYRWTKGTRTKILVVIVNNSLYRMFRVGQDDTPDGKTRGELSTDALNRSYEAREKMKKSSRDMKGEPAFRVELERISFSKEGAQITGWTNPRCTMARSTGTLFWKVKVE